MNFTSFCKDSFIQYGRKPFLGDGLDHIPDLVFFCGAGLELFLPARKCFLKVWALLVYVDDQAAKGRSENLPVLVIQSVLLYTF